jgi:lipopolysaccharide biosynthesis glycosyltransferase
MNLIYMCVFHQHSYINLLKLLITSISVNANINKEITDILVITSPSFQPLIQKELESFDLPLDYYLLDLNTLFESGCARLNIFTYDKINKYDNILYLDTDILVNSDVNVLFNLDISLDKVYALEEGIIGRKHWGSQFFNLKKYDRNMSAFTTGILLFRNSESMKSLFDSIKLHIVDYIHNKKNDVPECLDQPFIVYNAISQNKYDNQTLKPYAENNPSSTSSKKIIYHFPGGVGDYDTKLNKMTVFWTNMNKIPKVLFQTSKQNLDKYVVDMIKSNLSSDWEYKFYNDSDVIQFFINNPIRDLPDIIKKYNSIRSGAHRADLFRYYYLYVNGGFYMDSDAMLYVNIDTIVQNYNFVSVNSSCHPKSIFQGILGTSPKNEIIRRALYNVYNVDINILKVNYHYFCVKLYDIIKNDDCGYSIKLYEERRINNDVGDDILEGTKLLFKHYWKHKVIPNTTVT